MRTNAFFLMFFGFMPWYIHLGESTIIPQGDSTKLCDNDIFFFSDFSMSNQETPRVTTNYSNIDD